MAPLSKMVNEGGAKTIRQDERGGQEGCKRRFVRTEGVFKRIAKDEVLFFRSSVFVKLPAEDSEPDLCDRLVKALYGTRDAAQNWADLAFSDPKP